MLHFYGTVYVLDLCTVCAVLVANTMKLFFKQEHICLELHQIIRVWQQISVAFKVHAQLLYMDSKSHQLTFPQPMEKVQYSIAVRFRVLRNFVFPNVLVAWSPTSLYYDFLGYPAALGIACTPVSFITQFMILQ